MHDPAVWDDKPALDRVSATLRSCKSASAKSSRPDGALFRLFLSSQSSSTRRRKREEPNKKRGICMSPPQARRDRRPSVSTGRCLPRDFISWNRAPPSQTLVPIAWDQVEISIMRWGNFEIGGLAFVCVCCHRRQHSTGMVRTWGMMKWWSLDQTGAVGRCSRLQTQLPRQEPNRPDDFSSPLAAKRGRFHRHPFVSTQHQTKSGSHRYQSNPLHRPPSPSCCHFASALAHPEPEGISWSSCNATHAGI
jgi:hypothetical protein